MMKRLLTILSAALTAGAVSAAAPQQLIDIRTTTPLRWPTTRAPAVPTTEPTT